MTGQTIGSIASATGVTVQAVRYYERRGLLPKTLRSSGNYRLFTDEAVLVVTFIQQAQALGFTLSEIHDLLALRTLPQSSCGEVRDWAAKKVAVIEGKIALLQRMRRLLVQHIASCTGRGLAQACPILEALAQPSRGMKIPSVVYPKTQRKGR